MGCREAGLRTRSNSLFQRLSRVQKSEPEARARFCLEPTMAVPKKKVSKMKKGMRQSHDALTAPSYVEDKESGERRRPHHIDFKTGKYRGRQILTPKAEA